MSEMDVSYVALDTRVWSRGLEVLLVCSDEPVERRRVVALRPDEAVRLHRAGRLKGWTPHVTVSEERVSE